MREAVVSERHGTLGTVLAAAMVFLACAVAAAAEAPAVPAVPAAPAAAAVAPPMGPAITPGTPDAPYEAPRLDAWKVIGPGGGGAQYYPTVSPHDPNIALVRCDMTGAYITKDGGNSWRMFNGRGGVGFFVFDPVNPKVIYCRRLGLLRSTDGGDTWNLVCPDPSKVKGIVVSGDHAEESIVTTDGSSDNVSALAVDPADSKTLYAVMPGTQGSAFSVSTDWGKTWKQDAPLPGGGRAIYVDPKSPKGDRTIYVVGAASVSVREGGKWTNQKGPEGVAGFSGASGGFPAGGGKLVVYGMTGRGRRGAAAAAPGIYKSPDGGVSWEKVDADLTAQSAAGPLSLVAIAACLFDGNVAYVSFDGLRTQAGGAGESYFGTARTSDGGRTWKIVRKENTEPAANVHDGWITQRFGSGWGETPRYLGVAPTNPDICYGTDDGRTMMTRDGGRTWYGAYSKKSPNGEWSTTGIDVTTCYGVHFDPFDPNHLFISYTDIGLFDSRDGGVTWESSTVNGVPRGWVNTTYWMALDPKVKGRIWAVMSSPHDLPRPKMWRGSRSVSGYRGGVVASDDGGKTWRQSNDGMSPTAPTWILLDEKSPVDARVLYVAGFGTGVWKSADGGKTWTLKNSGLKGAEPFAYRITMNKDGVLYLVVARRSEGGEIGDENDGALYRSKDAAETWEPVALPAGCNGPNGLTIDPNDANRMYLAAWGREIPEGAAGGGIFLTTDGGKTWKNIFSKNEYIYDVTIDPRNTKLLYACGFESSAWRSADAGATWTRIRGFNFKWGHRVVCDPRNIDRIFVTTFGGSVWYGPAAGDPNAKDDIVTPAMRYPE